jgi:hypothetical protein
VIQYLLALLFGWLGLGLSIALASGLAWLLIPEVPWITSKLRQALLIVCICSAAGTVAFAKGVHTGTTLYRQKIEREIKNAVAQGKEGTAEALREFDASPTIPDDGFARD